MEKRYELLTGQSGYEQVCLFHSHLLCLEAKLKGLRGEQSPKIKGPWALKKHIESGLPRDTHTGMCVS